MIGCESKVLKSNYLMNSRYYLEDIKSEGKIAEVFYGVSRALHFARPHPIGKLAVETPGRNLIRTRSKPTATKRYRIPDQ